MNSKYQQYYNALNGKEFSEYVSNYSNSLSEINANFNSIESIMSSSSEKGLDYIKNIIIPSIKAKHSFIETGIRALSLATTKCNELIKQLNELKSESQYYYSCSDEEKKYCEIRISTLENKIEEIISSINQIKLEPDNNISSVANSSLNTTNINSSIKELKEKFIGDVDDISKYYIDPAYSTKAKKLVCFDNTTGETLEEGSTLCMKPGETRVLTVRLPYNAGEIDKIVRTTADGDSTYKDGSVVTAKSDVNPDPNVIDYVNYKSWSNHTPENVNLHTNYYDWVITAKNDGTATISQTCEYTNKNGNIPKAMIDIDVVVKS